MNTEELKKKKNDVQTKFIFIFIISTDNVQFKKKKKLIRPEIADLL